MRRSSILVIRCSRSDDRPTSSGLGGGVGGDGRQRQRDDEQVRRQGGDFHQTLLRRQTGRDRQPDYGRRQGAAQPWSGATVTRC